MEGDEEQKRFLNYKYPKMRKTQGAFTLHVSTFCCSARVAGAGGQGRRPAPAAALRACSAALPLPRPATHCPSAPELVTPSTGGGGRVHRLGDHCSALALTHLSLPLFAPHSLPSTGGGGRVHRLRDHRHAGRKRHGQDHLHPHARRHAQAGCACDVPVLLCWAALSDCAVLCGGGACPPAPANHAGLPQLTLFSPFPSADLDLEVELDEFTVSYKPQKISPKFPGTVSVVSCHLSASV